MTSSTSSTKSTRGASTASPLGSASSTSNMKCEHYKQSAQYEHGIRARHWSRSTTGRTKPPRHPLGAESVGSLLPEAPPSGLRTAEDNCRTIAEGIPRRHSHAQSQSQSHMHRHRHRHRRRRRQATQPNTARPEPGPSHHLRLRGPFRHAQATDDPPAAHLQGPLPETLGTDSVAAPDVGRRCQRPPADTGWGSFRMWG